MRWKRGNRLKLVGEAEASARICILFDEVRHALGVTAVPFLYQIYAAYPGFLELHWEVFGPVIASQQFSQLGDRLAAESYTRAHNYFDILDLGLRASTIPASAGIAPESCLSKVLDYYQYLDPRLLLIAAAQVQAVEGPIGQAQEGMQPRGHSAPRAAPALLIEEGAPPSIRRIWEERRRLIEIAFVSEEHRALAMWPAFYQEYWLALRKLAQSPLYHDCQYRIEESAWSLARELPARIETSIPRLLQAGLTEEDVSSLVRIHETVIHAHRWAGSRYRIRADWIRGGDPRRIPSQGCGHFDQPQSQYAYPGRIAGRGHT